MPKFESPVIEPSAEAMIDLEQEALEQDERELEEMRHGFKYRIGKLVNLGYGLATVFSILISSGALDEAKAQELKKEMETGKDTTVLVDDSGAPDNLPQLIEDNNVSEHIVQLSDSLITDCQNYLQNQEKLSGKENLAISWTAAIEKPNQFQLDQQLALIEKTVQAVRGQNFSNLDEEMIFINHQLDANLDDDKATPLLKNAFPEKEGQPAKGTLDCDSRSILIHSVLSELGNEADEVKLLVFKGHMILSNLKDNTFYDPTTDEIKKLDDLSPDLVAQSNFISNLKQFVSFNLGNVAVMQHSETKPTLPWFEKESTPEHKVETVDLYRLAVALDHNNVNASLNLLTYLERLQYSDPSCLDEIAKTYQNLIKSAVSRLEGNSDQIKMSLPQEVVIGHDQKDSALENAISQSDYLAWRVRFFAQFLKNKQPDKSADLSEALLKASAEQPDSINIAIDRPNLLECYFASGKYDKYLENVDQAEKDLENLILKITGPSGRFEAPALKEGFTDEDMKKKMTLGNLYDLQIKIETMEAGKLAASIMSGQLQITKDNVESYRHDPLLGPYINCSQMWSVKYADANETLKQWPGFLQLLEVLESTPTGQFKHLIERLGQSDATLSNDIANFLSKTEEHQKDFYYPLEPGAVKSLQLVNSLVNGEIEVNKENIGEFCEKYKNDHIVGAIIDWRDQSNYFSRLISESLTSSDWWQKNNVNRLIVDYQSSSRKER